MTNKSVFKLIGNTPLVQAKRIIKNPNITLLLKLEGQNPGGSVKDRPAFNMINEALKRGDIKKGDTLVEATSGNTGIALALFAKVLGVNMVLIKTPPTIKYGFVLSIRPFCISYGWVCLTF